jgi:hypothetical protein
MSDLLEDTRELVPEDFDGTGPVTYNEILLAVAVAAGDCEVPTAFPPWFYRSLLRRLCTKGLAKP